MAVVVAMVAVAMVAAVMAAAVAVAAVMAAVAVAAMAAAGYDLVVAVEMAAEDCESAASAATTAAGCDFLASRPPVNDSRMHRCSGIYSLRHPQAHFGWLLPSPTTDSTGPAAAASQ